MKSALEILNRVEPNGVLLDTETAIRAMEEYADQFKSELETDKSVQAEPLVMPKIADVGITEQPERPEDMPKTITVVTEDFIRLIMIAGSLCHPQVKEIYKQRVEGDIRKIALRHHINYVGEVKG